MLFVTPKTVTAANMTSNLLETPPAAYNSGTTYAAGAQVSVAGAAKLQTVYQSLQSSNTNHTPASSPTWWVKVCETYDVYSAGVTYAAGDFAVDATNHKVYKSAVGSNLGQALTDTSKWILQGYTNKWKAFDKVVNDQAAAPTIYYSLQLDGTSYVSAVTFLNLNAETVRVKVTDTIDGAVYDQTFSVVEPGGVNNLFQYFFNPVRRKKDFVILDLPPYASALIEVWIDVSTGDAKVGEVVFGFSAEIGDTQYGANVGIRDYSVKSTDAFGNATITPRTYSKKGNFEVFVAAENTDAVGDMLADLRATAIVYIGESSYGVTIVYGFYKDFQTVLRDWVFSVLNIEIEGLT